MNDWIIVLTIEKELFYYALPVNNTLTLVKKICDAYRFPTVEHAKTVIGGDPRLRGAVVESYSSEEKHVSDGA